MANIGYRSCRPYSQAINFAFHLDTDCLFLEVKLKKRTPLLAHSLYGYGIVAAISMVFATLVAFLWQGRYGALSINLLYALIIADIFKDRIKDIAREQLLRLFQKWIPDRRLLIYKDDKIPVGICKESFKFMDEQKLPEDIRKMRQQSHWINLVNDHRAENIMFIKRRFNFITVLSYFSKHSIRSWILRVLMSLIL